jgi:hypothetical protein
VHLGSFHGFLAFPVFSQSSQNGYKRNPEGVRPDLGPLLKRS